MDNNQKAERYNQLLLRHDRLTERIADIKSEAAGMDLNKEQKAKVEDYERQIRELLSETYTLFKQKVFISMDLNITLDIAYDDNFNIKKSTNLNIKLPNKDLFYAFESWMNLSRLSGDYVEAIDGSMNIVYDIIEESLSNELGLTEADFLNGRVEIDDPIVHDENNASAIVTIYVKRKK